MTRLHFNKTRLCLSAGAALAATAVSLYSPPVQACGGTFCDAGPAGMPVDQSGENVIFVMEPGSVEAHIQIQYDPDTTAQNFAWVIPVMTLPEFSVGSDLFFNSVLANTVPRYDLFQNWDFCGGDTGDSEGGTFTSGDSTAAESGTGGDEGGGGPTVVFEDSVGAFDIAVLSGGTIEEVMTWLGDNGYQQDPAAMPILGQYLDDGFMFAAMKLTHAEGNDTIHPITLKMNNTEEACVPLRLTAIAATQDMDVRTFFFSTNRVVPTNYRHVEVNPLKIDWVNFAQNYKEVVTLAVDAEGADGNAFVTEFAGAPAIPTAGFYSASWSSAATQAAGLGASPVGLIEQLSNANLIFCDDSFQDDCVSQHPLLDGLLNEYVPVPEGLDRVTFYSCLSCYEGLIDLTAWDATAFAADFTERIVDPGRRARDIVESFPYVTRMYTTISDHEMNEDPIFRENPDLEDVVSYRAANQVNHCDGTATMTLPDGREVYMPNPNVWPDIYPDDMPWEETISRGTMVGALMPVQNRTAEIDALLTQWNDTRPKDGGPEAEEGGAGGSGSSCACDSSGQDGGALALLGLGLLGLTRRRRR